MTSSLFHHSLYMMSTKNSSSLALTLLLLFSFMFSISEIKGQWSDFGVWTKVALSKEISDPLAFSTNFQTRLDYDASRLASSFINLALTRRLTPSLKFTIGLRLGQSRQKNFTWEPLRRLSTSLRFKTPLSESLAFSFRLRSTLTSELAPRLRLRPALNFKFSKKLRGAINFEAFYRPSGDGFYFSTARYRAELDFKISKRRWISVAYQLERDKNTFDPWTYHTIICGFDIELKSSKREK